MRVINIPYLMSLVLLTTLVCRAGTVTPLSGQVGLDGNVADDGDEAAATPAVDFPPVYFVRESEAFTPPGGYQFKEWPAGSTVCPDATHVDIWELNPESVYFTFPGWKRYHLGYPDYDLANDSDTKIRIRGRFPPAINAGTFPWRCEGNLKRTAPPGGGGGGGGGGGQPPEPLRWAANIDVETPGVIDLDVDSDNNNTVYGGPNGTDPEDSMEENAPGKYIPRNDGDEDGDTIQSFADGFGLAGENSSSSAGTPFVPIKLDLSQAGDIDWATARITIEYEYSSTNVPLEQITPQKTYHQPASGMIRLWKSNAASRAGQLIKPVENVLANAILNSSTEVTWYIEGIGEGTVQGLIIVKFKPNATAEELEDSVYVTVIHSDLDVDSDNNNGTGAPAGDGYEDRIEAAEMLDGSTYCGKLIDVNDGDKDSDELVDYNDNKIVGGAFAKLALTLNAPLGPTALVKFDYVPCPPNVQPADSSGKIRIWRKDASAERYLGDYVAPATYSAFPANTPVTLYIEGLATAANVPIKIFVDPDGASGNAGFVHTDTVLVSIIKVDLVSVEIDENGSPVVVGGEAQVGEVIDLTEEGLSTYAPSPGTNRGELARETTLDGGGQWVTVDVNGSTAELTMTYGEKELFTSWSLTKVSGMELFDRFVLVGDPDRSVQADLYWASPPQTTTDLKVKLTDKTFTGSPAEFDLSYYVFLPDAGSSYYSNYRMTGPGVDIGYPPLSDRNLAMLKVDAGGADLDFGSDFFAQFEDDFETHDLTMTKRSDGAYYSEVLVPVLHVDAGEDTGLEGDIPAVKVLKFESASPTFNTFSAHIADNVMNSIASLDGKVDQAMLISALMTDEFIARNLAISEPARRAVENLGIGVTPVLQPMKSEIVGQLKSHRMWIHSGHGGHTQGITFLDKDGLNYRIDVLSAADIAGVGKPYRLVFMNTCQSTDKYYEYDGSAWVPQPDPAQHKVLDIGDSLNADNYVGWDCSVSRRLSVKIPGLLNWNLNGEGGSWTRRDVSQAVQKIRDVVGSTTSAYGDKHYVSRLRCVRSDGTKFDWNKAR